MQREHLIDITAGENSYTKKKKKIRKKIRTKGFWDWHGVFG